MKEKENILENDEQIVFGGKNGITEDGNSNLNWPADVYSEIELKKYEKDFDEGN